MNGDVLHIKIFTPNKVVLDQQADKVIAESEEGLFCLKPRHIDFVSALVPGILYCYRGAQEQVVAVDEGILVKCGPVVRVSTISAVPGTDLQELEKQVRSRFRQDEANEDTLRRALRNMEANVMRYYLELQNFHKAGYE